MQIVVQISFKKILVLFQYVYLYLLSMFGDLIG